MVGNSVAPDIPARFRVTAARFGESIGVCSDQGNWSYAALDGPTDVAVRVRIGATPSGDPAMLDFAAMMRSAEPVSVRARDPRHATAAILYTSGTTGRPKGAMLSHANLIANADGVTQALGLTPADRILVVLPMFHAFAATVGVLTPLLHGLGIVLDTA